MTEGITDILTNGTGFTPSPSSGGGFNVGSLWDGHYDFTACGVNAVGDIPIPTQAKIDRWSKATGYLAAEWEDAVEKERAARMKESVARMNLATSSDVSTLDERTLEERKAEVDKAVAESNEIVDKFRAALADVTNGNPTKAQLAKIPAPFILQFATHVGGLLNPNV